MKNSGAHLVPNHQKEKRKKKEEGKEILGKEKNKNEKQERKIGTKKRNEKQEQRNINMKVG
jgi:uncharacterized membrane-anchored protein